MECRYRNGPVVLVSKEMAYIFPLAYAYLAGYLRARGEEVRMLFRGTDPKSLARQILQTNPVLVGFGSLYPELKEIGTLIRLLNDAGRQFPIVIGGQMVTPVPDLAVRVTGADFGVIGEGEIILYKLVRSLREGRNPSEVGGLAIRNGATCELTGPGEFIEDLSQLPPVPYDLFPESEWLSIGRWYAGHVPQPHWRFRDRVINVHGGRGCPFTCNFCYHHSRPRYRPIDQMLSEGFTALDRFKANMLYFSDDLVLASPKRARQLVEGIRASGRRIEYSVSTRFDILQKLDDALLADMKATGCRIMGLGIESGSNRMLKIIGKNCTAEIILEQLRRLKRAGIMPGVSIMVGQHTETMEDVDDSVRLMRQSVQDNPNIGYTFTITTPFPGSPLYERIFKEKYLRDDQEFHDRYFSTSKVWQQVVNLSALPDEEIHRQWRRLLTEYRRERARALGRRVIFISYLQIIMGIGDGILRNRIFAWFSRFPSLRFISKVYEWVYYGILRQLDDMRLRVEGIEVQPPERPAK